MLREMILEVTLPESYLQTTMLLAKLKQDFLTAGDPSSTGLHCEVGGGDGAEDDLDRDDDKSIVNICT